MHIVHSVQDMLSSDHYKDVAVIDCLLICSSKCTAGMSTPWLPSAMQCTSSQRMRLHDGNWSGHR